MTIPVLSQVDSTDDEKLLSPPSRAHQVSALSQRDLMPSLQSTRQMNVVEEKIPVGDEGGNRERRKSDGGGGRKGKEKGDSYENRNWDNVRSIPFRLKENNMVGIGRDGDRHGEDLTMLPVRLKDGGKGEERTDRDGNEEDEMVLPVRLKNMGSWGEGIDKGRKMEGGGKKGDGDNEKIGHEDESGNEDEDGDLFRASYLAGKGR